MEVNMSIIQGKKVKIFALSSSRSLAQEVCDTVGMPLAECEVVRFADGEINVNITESVRGHHVFVIQSTNAPVNEHLMELLIMTDALKRASAATINLIIPYYGYSRQDRKAKARQPITAKLVANLIETAGASRVIAMDLHAGQIQGFFDIPIDNFQGLPILAGYFIKKHFSDIVVVSPDHGGTTRAREFAKVLEAPIAIIDKRRPEPNKAEVMNIIGSVEGKVAILVDDIVDTAGTITVGAQALIEAGATAVYATATHAILSGPAIERIQNSPITELVVTNTISLPEDKRIDKIKQLSVGTLLGRCVMRIISDEPISRLFDDMLKHIE